VRKMIVAAAFAAAFSTAALAQDTVKFADVVEISGGGAVVGSNWKNAIDLAVSEINAKGGLLGKKIEVTITTPRPIRGSRAHRCKRRSTASPMCCSGRSIRAPRS